MPKITKATIDDATNILTLQKLAYQSEAELLNDYSIQPLTQTVEDVKADFKHNLILKYVINGEIVGSVRGSEENGTCYVTKLMVHPKYQNRGIAQSLMNEMERYFPEKRFELHTAKENKKNVLLYEKLGYQIYKTVKLDIEETLFVFMEKDFTK